ncbi:DUF2309 domain-containing protein, partial [Pseudomonas sp. GW456-L12]
PYLGQADRDLAETAALLGRVAGTPVTMPRGWYRDQIARGVVSDADLTAAWENTRSPQRPPSVAALKLALEQPSAELVPLPTIADLAANAAG